MSESTLELKKKVVLQLLNEYQANDITVDAHNNEIYSNCVIHGGDNSRALNINYAKLVYVCHTRCNRGGNLIQLIANVENCKLKDAANKLRKLLGSNLSEYTPSDTPIQPFGSGLESAKTNMEVREALYANSVPCTVFRNFQISTLSFFNIRLGKGSTIFSDYAIIPIYNILGNLVALKLRDISDKRKSKYCMFPSGIEKTRLLFNYHNIDTDYVVVVEGEFKAMKLYEWGFPCVATMGSSLSPIQANMLLPFESIIVFKDGNSGGDRFESDILDTLGQMKYQGSIKCINTPPGMDPDIMYEDEVKELIIY